MNGYRLYRCNGCGEQYTGSRTPPEVHSTCRGDWVLVNPDAPGAVTERAAVLREREAFRSGAFWAKPSMRDDTPHTTSACAAGRYPLPTVTRPRVAEDDTDSNNRFLVIGGVLHFKRANGFGPVDPIPLDYKQWEVNPGRIAIWAKLFANPTEECEDTP